MATQIVAFTLLTADGSVRECSLQKDEACFQAGRVSLGALGVLSTVTIQAVSLSPMKRVETHMPVHRLFTELPALLQAKRRVQYWFIPNSGEGKMAEFIPLEATPSSLSEAKANRETHYATMAYLGGALEMTGFAAALAAASFVKPLKPTVTSALVDAFCKTPKTVLSTTDGALHFSEPSGSPVYTEMEAFLDVSDVQAAFEAVVAVQAKYDIMFPSALRFVDADDIWLSPCYQRRSVVFSVSQHRNEPVFDALHKDIFAALSKFAPRPHWGKRHPYNATDLAILYPRWNDFLALRKQLDPDGMFLNDHLKSILGL
jgi:FAD/FMN-containing dehydrogenase